MAWIEQREQAWLVCWREDGRKRSRKFRDQTEAESFRLNDGGVDAEAVLSLEGLTSVMTKVQGKRWAHTVSPRVVRELRGALKVDERGLIVTTAEFTDEAIREAQAEAKPGSVCSEAANWPGFARGRA